MNDYEVVDASQECDSEADQLCNSILARTIKCLAQENAPLKSKSRILKSSSKNRIALDCFWSLPHRRERNLLVDTVSTEYLRLPEM